MLHQEITEQILAAAFDVAHELGAGFVENVYEKAMFVALKDKGLHASLQVPFKVKFRNVIVGDYVADMIVEDKVLVELKAVKTLTPEHQAQVINYLEASGLEVGLLINFGNKKIEYKRLHR
ncbi:MAG: GxxExxY protein [Candidatus Hydrogenedentota bacterium]